MDATGKREKTNAMSAAWFSRRTGAGRAWMPHLNEGGLALLQVSTEGTQMVEQAGAGFEGVGRGGEEGREIPEVDVLLCDGYDFDGLGLDGELIWICEIYMYIAGPCMLYLLHVMNFL
jgi:hypothetical protein